MKKALKNRSYFQNLEHLRYEKNRKINQKNQNPGKFGHKYINNIEITQKIQNPG